MKTKTSNWILAALAILLAGNAWADRYPYHRDYRHHHNDIRFGVYLGTPWPYATYPYPPSAYWPRVYAPPVAPVIVTTPPPVYVEQTPAPPAVPVLEAGYWYYCQEAGAYYPHVKQCAGPWLKVAPQPQQ